MSRVCKWRAGNAKKKDCTHYSLMMAIGQGVRGRGNGDLLDFESPGTPFLDHQGGTMVKEKKMPPKVKT